MEMMAQHNQGLDEDLPYYINPDNVQTTPRTKHITSNQDKQDSTYENPIDGQMTKTPDNFNQNDSIYNYIQVLPDPVDTGATDSKKIYQELQGRNQYQPFTRKSETTQKTSEARSKKLCNRGNILLVIVLFISLLAIILVILNIQGTIGPTCDCKPDQGETQL